jgi:cytochrome o ubiquinol oxidase operon protein cyoD
MSAGTGTMGEHEHAGAGTTGEHEHAGAGGHAHKGHRGVFGDSPAHDGGSQTGDGDGNGDPGHSGHGHGGAGHGDGAGMHVTLRGYATGFFAAVFLTAIPFWLVMGKTFSSAGVTAAVILGLAGVQIVVHMIYFLHMSPKSEGGWNLLALLFTIMLVVIALSGSLWVMYHLNHNMMPDSMMNMHNMP